VGEEKVLEIGLDDVRSIFVALTVAIFVTTPVAFFTSGRRSEHFLVYLLYILLRIMV